MDVLIKTFRMAMVVMAVAVGMVSCAKDTEVEDPYANWEERNVQFIDSIYNVATNPPEGETWKMYLDYAISFDNNLGDIMKPYEPKKEDYVYVKFRNADDVLVEVAAPGGDVEYPILYGDTVVAAYQGFLINGVRFDGTHYGKFDKDVNDNFTKFDVVDLRNINVGLVGGWVNTLLHMKCPMEDAVEVYIPYQLAYGEADHGSDIPGYSALKFEMYIDEVIKPKLDK